MLKIQIYCCLLLLFSGVVFGETGKAPDPNLVHQGEKLYEIHCIGCHQKNGVGEYPVPWGIRAPDFVPAMPLNETSHAWHHGDEQLAATILNGLAGRMPGFAGILTTDQALTIVAYIKSLWSPEILACQGPKHMSCMQ